MALTEGFGDRESQSRSVQVIVNTPDHSDWLSWQRERIRVRLSAILLGQATEGQEIRVQVASNYCQEGVFLSSLAYCKSLKHIERGSDRAPF